MSAIDFVARTSAGEYQRGVVGDNGAQSILAGSGTDVSINLYPGQVAAYERQGQALVLVLVNGERITVENYFDAAGSPAATLYVSAGGELFEVELSTGEGGAIYPNYAGTGSFGKFNPDDAFFFLRGPELLVDAPAEGGGLPILPLVGAAAAAGLLAAVAGGGKDKDKDGDIDDEKGDTASSDEPFIKIGTGVYSSGDVTDATEVENGVAIGGTGTPGGDVVVTVGEATAETVVDEDGTWQVTFEPGEIEGGEYTTPVVAVITNEDGTAEDDDLLAVDSITFVTIDQDSIGGDGTVNDAERDAGTVVRGTSEAGATVVVTINDVSQTVIADENGNWQTTFAEGTFEEGTFEQGVSAVATDAYNNTATATGTFLVDTETFVTIDTENVEGDGVVNFDERQDGVTLTGTAEAGATVILTAKGTEYTTTADATGAWSVDVARGDIKTGETLQEVSVTATDIPGNTASTDGTFLVDTETFVTIDTENVEGDGVVNFDERQDGVTLTGTAEAGATVILTAKGTEYTTTADATGAWSVDVARGDIKTGETLQEVSVTATDIPGNTASTDGNIAIDTTTFVTVNDDTIAGDGVVNKVERIAGVTLTGTAEAGADVTVVFSGDTMTTVADADGNWSVDLEKSQLSKGETTQGVSVSATDAAGNTASTDGTIVIDTIVEPLTGVDDVTADDTLNAVEATAGVTLEGTVEAGSEVIVTFEGTTRTATVTGTNWSVDFDADDVPPGDYTAEVSITATDEAGNDRTITDEFRVDTVVPEVPRVTSFDKGIDGFRSIGVSDTDEGLAVTALESGGKSSALAVDAVADSRFDEVDLYFASSVPDGTQLVISSTDAAGNQNATLLVLDEAGTDLVNIGHNGLSNFDLGAIDLNFALDSELAITAADLEGLSRNDNTLVVHGGSDDKVTLAGATATGNTQDIDGRSYDIYALGDEGGKVILDPDITVIT